MISNWIKMLRNQPSHIKLALLALAAGVIVPLSVYTVRSFVADETLEEEAPRKPGKPEFVRGIHLTSWVTGSKKAREKVDKLLDETELNTVVIAIKEYQGEVYIPGVATAEKNKAFVNAMPDIKEYVADLKGRGVYTIARIVVFKDKIIPKKRPDLAVKTPDGDVWRDRSGNTWVDPYNKGVWEYIFEIGEQAVKLGFEEIQFDYIRYPSDGNTKLCRYSYANHNSSSAARNLDEFLIAANKRFKPLGVPVSIDVFGLTPSVPHDMGIGQKFAQMTQWVDYVSPMIYPSHYARGEYGIPNPNAEPYKVVYKTMYDSLKKLGPIHNRMRPYLQDFSLGHKYGPQEVRAQIQACEDLGFKEWLMWSPNSNYQKNAYRRKDGTLPDEAVFPKSWIVTISSTTGKFVPVSPKKADN